MDRPDLTDVDLKIRAYVEYLESLVKVKPISSGKDRLHTNMVSDTFVDQVE